MPKQPTEKPYAFRLSGTLRERFERYCAANGLNVNKATQALFEIALSDKPRAVQAALAVREIVPKVSDREARDAFWRKTGAFNPKGKKS